MCADAAQYYAFVEEKQKVHCLNTLFSKVRLLRAALGFPAEGCCLHFVVARARGGAFNTSMHVAKLQIPYQAWSMVSTCLGFDHITA